MTTNTYIGNGIYVTSATPGIISCCDVAITNANSPYTALQYDKVIRADATSGAITINLPTAVGIAGKEYHIFRTDIIASTNLITIDANSTETIDSNLTYILYPAEWIKLESDGANWQVIGRPNGGMHGYYFLKGATANRRYVGGWLQNISAFLISTTPLAANTLWAFPLIVARTTKFDTISFQITSVSTAGNSRAGLYRDNGNNFPGALIFDTGAISTTSTGLKDTTITSSLQVLQPGLYWLVYEQDTATGEMYVLNSITNCLGLLGTQMNTANNTIYYYTVAHTFGALPDPYTVSGAGGNSNSTVGAGLPAVGLRPV